MKAQLLTSMQTQEACTKKLLKKPQVCGTGVGEKWVNGKPSGQHAILVFVEKKYPPDAIRAYSANAVVPPKIDGIPTDVIEVGKIKKQAGFRTKIRPIIPGYSCGHKNVTAGTIGGFFRDSSGIPVILSNNHVLSWENKAKIGDEIYQPGLLDSNAKNLIAKLRKFNKLTKSTNLHDSAIAEIDTTLLRQNMVSPIYPVVNKAIVGFGEPTVNMQVHKIGRTTGYTTGRIIGLNATFGIDYDFGNARFQKCVVISPISKGGDSGSLICDIKMRAVALLFAGSPKITLANDIAPIVQYYGLEVWDTPKIAALTVGDDDWNAFTIDGSINYLNGVLTVVDNANHHCFLEKRLHKRLKRVVCKVNTGTDEGTTWGPGMVLQFPNGMLKVNLRHHGGFGGYINNKPFLNVGRTQPNKTYKLRLRRDKTGWYGDVKDGNKWYTAVSAPISMFPLPPVAVRIGKTGYDGSTTDYSPPNTQMAGPEGTCTFTDIQIV